MDCPFSRNHPVSGSCNRDCAFRDDSNPDRPCLLAQACAAYVKAQKEEEKILQDAEPRKSNWEGAKMWIR